MIFSVKYLLILIIAIAVVGCQNNKAPKAMVETDEQIAARTISEKDIARIDFIEFGLSEDSQEATADWQKYNELQEQIEFLKKGDFSFFKGETELVKTFTKEFRSEMPENIKTREISARITALDTKIQKLNSILRLNSSTKQEKLSGIGELLIAFRNFKLQINKKFEFEKNNVLRPVN